MTNKWWELRLQYQGIVPPVPRSERDFDPGSKYHIPADALYAKYKTAFIKLEIKEINLGNQKFFIKFIY